MELSVNIQALAVSPLPPDVVAAVHVALSAIAAEQSVFIPGCPCPLSLTMQVFAIFAAVHVARSVFAAVQPVLLPPTLTVHVFDTRTSETDAPVIFADSAVAQLVSVSQFVLILIVCGLPPSTVTIKS